MTLERSSPLATAPPPNGGVLVPHNPPAPNSTSPNKGSPITCAGCGKRICDKFLLKAMDVFWHEDCLKCGCCDCRLGEVGSSLYSKANLILCKRDYLRLFGTTGYCAACHKMIPPFEMVMRARTNVYHLECFACQQCNHRFCVGDRFYLIENRILCEYDYEERKVFPSNNLTPFGSNNNNSSSPNLASLKRQVNAIPSPMEQQIPVGGGSHNPHGGGGIAHHLSDGGGNGGANAPNDDASSGYGSPDSVTMDSR